MIGTIRRNSSIYGIAAGMSYLHSHGILHRNLNPSSILLDEYLHPKISDFSLLVLEDSTINDLSIQTQEGLVGTPSYLAPETFRENKYSKSGDVYAFALTVYKILTGNKWFENINIYELIKKLFIEGCRPPIPDDLPDSYRDLIERCWSESPEDRPSFDEILYQLKGDSGFITDLVDESEFYDYVDYIDCCKITFDFSNKLLFTFDEIISGKKSAPAQEINNNNNSNNKERVEPSPNAKSSSSKKLDFENVFFDPSDFYVKQIPDLEKSAKKTFIASRRRDNSCFSAKIGVCSFETAKQQQFFMKMSMFLLNQNHPAIASVFGINYHDFDSSSFICPTILTEYMQNGTVKYNIHAPINRHLTPTKKIICLIGTAHAMKFVHRYHIYHLNLKPSNILLDEKFCPKICDFNMRAENNEAAGSEADKIDVFLFAMVAYEMVSEIEPINNTEFKKLIENIVSGERPKFNESFTDPMKDLISQCWSVDPKKRPSFDKIYQKLSSNYKAFFREQVDEKEVNEYIETLVNFMQERMKRHHKKSINKKQEENTSEKVDKIIEKDEENLPEKVDNSSEKVDDSDDKVDKEKEKENCFFGIDDEAHFETVKKLGEGMTSIAFKIIDKRTNIPLCKKVLKVEGATFKDLQNAVKEFELLHSIHHPCICYAIAINTSETYTENSDTGDEVTTIAILLEFIDFNLKDMLASNTLNNTLKTKIVVEICHGMRYLHSKGHIYRDLKIDNIMLNSVFQAKMIDFGLAKINECLLGEEMMSSISMTKGVGNMHFMSPEMMKEEEYDNKTDVFSFGIVLFVIFVGKLPKQSMKEKAMGTQISLPEESSSISKCCIDLISMCISFDPKERPSFDEILDYLRKNKFMLSSDVDPSIVEQRDNELELIRSS